MTLLRKSVRHSLMTVLSALVSLPSLVSTRADDVAHSLWRFPDTVEVFHPHPFEDNIHLQIVFLFCILDRVAFLSLALAFVLVGSSSSCVQILLTSSIVLPMSCSSFQCLLELCPSCRSSHSAIEALFPFFLPTVLPVVLPTLLTIPASRWMQRAEMFPLCCMPLPFLPKKVDQASD